MTQFLNDLPTVLALIALVLVIFEVIFFGFGNLFLIYAAIGCIVTGLAMYLGLLPSTIMTAVVSVALIAGISALCLWRSLKKLQQSKRSIHDQPNVFQGITFRLKEDLRANERITHQYSGIEWVVSLDPAEKSLPAGTEVEVIKTTVGQLVVRNANR